VDAIEVTWLAELQGGYRFRFQRWDLNVLVGYKAVGLDLASGAKDIEGNFIFHGPVLKLAAEF
jgi:hypothetical protein